MTWYVVDKSEYLDALAQVGGVYREVLGKTYPAMSLVEISGLVETGAKLEIEVTAVVPEEKSAEETVASLGDFVREVYPTLNQHVMH